MTTPTVLLVDDDREIVAGLTLRLSRAGYFVAAAYDGRAGVLSARRFLPDVIVMDIRMPELDGLSALVELQADSATRDIPVIVLSASLVQQDEALDLGARFFLAKPHRGADLVAAVDAARATSIVNTPGEARRRARPDHPDAGAPAGALLRYNTCEDMS